MKRRSRAASDEAQPSGLAELYMWLEKEKLKSKPREEVDHELAKQRLKSLIVHGERVEGGRQKAAQHADRHRTQKEHAVALHSELRVKDARNPRLKDFCLELRRRFRNEAWNDSTIEGWWKKLNRGQALF